MPKPKMSKLVLPPAASSKFTLPKPKTQPPRLRGARPPKPEPATTRERPSTAGTRHETRIEVRLEVGGRGRTAYEAEQKAADLLAEVARRAHSFPDGRTIIRDPDGVQPDIRVKITRSRGDA